MTTIVVAKSPGGPDVLELAEVPTPSPGPNQVRIDVRAIGVNPIDHKLLAGGRGAPFPFRPGLEVSGVVAELGPGVTSFRVGDAVLAFGVSGGYASELVVAAEDVFHKPANVSFEEAAGLLLVGTTAVHALEKVRLTSGETVLAHGASGSVGQVLVQLAKARGARIIGTSSAKNFDLIRSLGAEPLAYGPGLVERVQALAPKVDAAVDLIGTDEAIDVSLALVADRQRITTIVGGAYPDAKGIQKIGGGPGADPGTELRKAARTELVELAGTGALKIRVTRTFPLQQAREALQFVKDGHAAGKVVLIP